jgi:hypothetical protein
MLVELLQSVAKNGKKDDGLQAIETLNSTNTDDRLGQRIIANMTEVIVHFASPLHEGNPPPKNKIFTDCLLQFCKTFRSQLNEQHLVTLLNALVAQILHDDQQMKKKTLDLRKGKSEPVNK